MSNSRLPHSPTEDTPTILDASEKPKSGNKPSGKQVDTLSAESVEQLRKRLQWPIRRFTIQLTTEAILTGRVPEGVGKLEYQLEQAIVRIAKNTYRLAQGNDLITEGLSQDTVTPSRPGEHKKQKLERDGNG